MDKTPIHYQQQAMLKAMDKEDVLALNQKWLETSPINNPAQYTNNQPTQYTSNRPAQHTTNRPKPPGYKMPSPVSALLTTLVEKARAYHSTSFMICHKGATMAKLAKLLALVDLSPNNNELPEAYKR